MFNWVKRFNRSKDKKNILFKFKKVNVLNYYEFVLWDGNKNEVWVWYMKWYDMVYNYFFYIVRKE